MCGSSFVVALLYINVCMRVEWPVYLFVCAMGIS